MNKGKSRINLLSLAFILCSLFSFSQVTTEVDTTKIRIGEQISYKINVEADSTAFVVFPEGQTFLPLESVEALNVDTLKKERKIYLSKIYKLTQFDSGSYTIPKQKILIDNKPFLTDSLNITVATIEVDTTKQKLYDIKPIIEVDKSKSDWWKWLLIIVLTVALVSFLLYWFIWRKKPLSEEEEIALLPAFDRAKLALKKLDESQYLMRSEVKEYYSELTLVIRKYLDEKVYDRSLESTTDELITRLQLLKEGNQFPFTKETLHNLETILKRADLVKFAKSAPDTALIEMDRETIEKEVENVKACLPEPTEEEKLLNQQYKEAQERKKKRRKVILTSAIVICLAIATFVGFGIKYGFGYVTDTIVGDPSKELLEGEWVESAYGFPPIYITTPQVLKREEFEIPEQFLGKIETSVFRYLSQEAGMDIQVSTTKFIEQDNTQGSNKKPMTDDEKAEDLLNASENYLKKLEQDGAQNITVKREQFITPNNAAGLKTFGSMNLDLGDNRVEPANYINLLFRAENVRQQILLLWRAEDSYADEIIERITTSIELIPDELAEEEE